MDEWIKLGGTKPCRCSRSNCMHLSVCVYVSVCICMRVRVCNVTKLFKNERNSNVFVNSHKRNK